MFRPGKARKGGIQLLDWHAQNDLFGCPLNQQADRFAHLRKIRLFGRKLLAQRAVADQRPGGELHKQDMGQQEFPPIMLIKRLAVIDIHRITGPQKGAYSKTQRCLQAVQLAKTGDAEKEKQVFGDHHHHNGPPARILLIKVFHQKPEPIVHCGGNG